MKKKFLPFILVVMFTCSLLGLNMIGPTAAQLDHDVAVIGVTPSLTSVRLGELVNITVATENQGNFTETFNVTVYYDSKAIETETNITLAAGANKNLTFTWNTTNIRDEVYATAYKQKTYTVSATATITTDADPDDNTLESSDNVDVISQYIAVIPRSTVDLTLIAGTNYTVTIYTDYNGTDIWGWQFELTYNPNVLEGVTVTNGDLITKAKNDNATSNLGTFDNTFGRLTQTNAYFFYKAPDEPYVTSGPGILANITFNVVGTGDSDITLVKDKTKVQGYQGGESPLYEIVSNWKPDIRHIFSGYFANTAEAVTHDVAVVSITFSPTSVSEGENVTVTVVVENQGTAAETFNVTAYYDRVHPNYRIEKEEKTVQALGPGVNTSVTFVWNTTEIDGTFFIWAVASIVSAETDTEDNQLKSTDTVTVKKIPGGGFPLELIIGIVAAVIVIGLVTAFMMRRRKKPPPIL